MDERVPGWAAAWWRPALIVVAAVVAYHNSFAGAYLFDDGHSIRESDFVKDPRPFLSAESVLAPRIASRLSFAANYAVHGLDVRGFHLVNLAVHVLAALLLYDLTRRTLLLDSLRGRYADRAADLAVVAALVWAVHPLTTQAVTYIVQRMESMMALFYLGVLYGVLRGATAHTRWGRTVWSVGAVLSCGLSMASKEVGVTAPVVALLYDRCLIGRSFRAAVSRRWALYLGGFAVAGVLGASHAGLLDSTPPPSYVTAGFGMKNLTPWEYARSQPGVILYYLRLALWPHPLTLDYEWPVARDPVEIALTAAAVAVLLAAAVWAAWRRPGLGFLGLAFFLILAPTSSVLPIKDLAVEHRMYLPLAPLVVLAVVAGDAAVRAAGTRAAVRRAAVAAGCVIAALAVATIARNDTYRSPREMWLDVLAKRPDSARAHTNVGHNFVIGDRDHLAALPHFEAALRIQPDDVHHLRNLANCLRDLNRTEEAILLYRRALAIEPGEYWAKVALAECLIRVGRTAKAVPLLEDCLREAPQAESVRAGLVAALRQLGRYDDSLRLQWEHAARIPNDPEATAELGITLLLAGRAEEAAETFRTAARLAPDRGKYPLLRATALEDAGQHAAAEAEARAAAPDPDWFREAARTAWRLATDPNPGLRDGPLAVLLARQLVTGTTGLDPGAQDVLGVSYAAVGRYREAATAARRAIDLSRGAPGYPPAFADQFRQRLALYEQGRPYVRPAAPTG